jgi:hypothetical protein
MRVLVLGFPHFVNMLVPMLSDADIQFIPYRGRRWVWVWELLCADACYFIGGRWKHDKFLDLALLMRKKIVMHWVGTDVKDASAAYSQSEVSHDLIVRCQHWAEVSWTADELCAVGIPAEVVPLTSALTVSEAFELPSEFTILAYLPAGRALFYGAQHILQLARELPSVQVLCVGSAESPFHFASEPLPPNLLLFGRPESLRSVYFQSTLLVRMTEHDGLSFMVLEALAHERYVIWSYALDGAPGLYHAKGYKLMLEHVKALQTQHQHGQLPPNHDGAKFIHTHYDREIISANIRARFANINK